MTTGGWIIMIISVGSVVSLLIGCVWKVLTTPRETEHLRGVNTHTPDRDREISSN